MNFAAIFAIWKRQVGSLLLNPLGYFFILVFVCISSGVLFWRDAWFERNVCDLWDLLFYMPWMLVVLLPALAMGSWASERELGTEEHLLTLPLSIGDALLGKWLGVSTYFTIALLCSLSNVLVMNYVGAPDWGLAMAAYIGWWLTGLVFAALGVLASTLVALPAIAFVLGIIFSVGALLIFNATDWFGPFNRGLVPLGHVVIAFVLVALGLGLGAVLLSSRRWQPSRYAKIAGYAGIFLFTAVTLVNVSVQAERKALDRDLTQEKLSTLSPASLELLKDLEKPVSIVAVISSEPPLEVQPKVEELERTLQVLSRNLGSKVDVKILRPSSPFDKEGREAANFYSIKPHKVMANSVAGGEYIDVYLGVYMSCGTHTQRIEYFDPGISAEYELVRGMRAVTQAKRKVVGIAQTDLKLTAGFDMMSRQPTDEWNILGDWRKQYEVRELNLDAPVAKDIDVLVVPQPSRLGEKQLRVLHDYIWEGRPALVMEDPFPRAAGPQLGTSQEKAPPQMGMPQEAPEPKGNLTPLLNALGVDLQPEKIVWSDFNPVQGLRRVIPKSFVWAMKSEGSIPDTKVTMGIEGLLIPFPGVLRESAEKAEGITLTPLLYPSKNAEWGTRVFEDMRRPDVTNKAAGKDAPLPYMAVEITGKMARAYPFPSEPPSPGKTPPKPEGVGKVSDKDIHVILIADTDLASDLIYEFYKKDKEHFSALSKEDQDVLFNLRNVQFMANCLDVLSGETALLELRSHSAKLRTISRLDEVRAVTQRVSSEAELKASDEAEKAIKDLQKTFNDRIKAIQDDKEMDENAKENEISNLQESAGRQLQEDIAKKNEELDEKVHAARAQEKEELRKACKNIRWGAILIPTCVLGLLALGVLAYRIAESRVSVPASRRRDEE